MKILLTAINAKYIHSNLAIYSLRACAGEHKPNVELAEFTINNQKDYILEEIYKKKPDVLCFSVYIWNLDYVESVAREFKKICPNVPIWVGGPEVSYEVRDFLDNHSEIDGIMIGEGEDTFREVCDYYAGKRELSTIEGIAYRDNGVVVTKSRGIMDMSRIPFCYDTMEDFSNRIIYYESSRGCPFSCSYCLSSVDKALRFRDTELVKKELKLFMDQRVPQIKFVDRTFNCNHAHAMEIWRFIKENDNGITNFHFEISADILSDEEIEMMKDMRPRLIQLEIGVQSTNEKTIEAIKRKMDFAKLSDIVNRINNTKKVHQHLDLIAGLPYEDYESFRLSFNDVYGLRPEQLQLGFLKVLKGSLMHEEAEKYGIVYKTNPVYEVLKTKWLSYDDVLKLKQIEDVLEVYYNSRQFENTMEYLLRFFETPFDMYEHIANYYDENNLFGIKHTRISRYIILLDMLGKTVLKNHDKEYNIARQLLVHDLYLREKVKSRPEFADDMNIYKDKYNEFYKDEEHIRNILPAYHQYDTKQIARMTHIEHYTIDIQELIENKKIIEKDYFILYDYLERNPINYQARIYVF